MHHSENTEEFIQGTKRNRADMNRLIPQMLEGFEFPVILQRLPHDGGGFFQARRQLARNGNDTAVWAIDGQSDEVFAVCKLLDGFLQALKGAAFQVALHIPGEAFPKHLGSPLQVTL